MMMTTILSKHSMKTLFTGYIKWDGASMVVMVEYRPRSYDLEPKPKVRIRPCCGLVGLKGFKDSSVRVNVYHPILEHSS